MKGFVRRQLEKLVNRHGYVLAPESKWMNLRKIAEQAKSGDLICRHLKQLVAERSIDCVFDVGANDGEFVSMLRNEVGYDGWVISFEPIPEVARGLERKAEQDERWEVVCCALGKAPEERAFFEMESDVFSSFLEPDGERPAKYRDSCKVLRERMVEIDTVDNRWKRITERLSVSSLLLKIDTQGFDLEVFSGAQDSLSEIPVILSELSFFPIYRNAPDYREALDRFEAAGYFPTVLAPISFDEGHAALEMDALFVSRKDRGAPGM